MAKQEARKCNTIMRTKVTVYALMALFLLISCETKIDDPHGVDDPEAKLYRMYIDNGDGGLTQRKFNGRLQLADIESRFGPLEQLPQDSLGNYIGDWKYFEDRAWWLIAGPNFVGVNVITVDKEGNLSSAVDLNGDRIAEIVDIRLADRTRFTFADELIGMGFLEHWLLNQNPFCNELDITGVGYPIMNCSESGSNGGQYLPGGGIPDFFEDFCNEYLDSPQRQIPNVVNHGDRIHERHSIRGPDYDNGMPTSRTYTRTTLDGEGNHIVTNRFHMEYDREGHVVRETVEKVVGEGRGTRTVIIYNEDGSSTSYEETFTTDVDSYLDDIGNQNPPPATSSTPETTDPGPVDGPLGPEGDLEAWCEATVPYESGVEQAATRDPSAFRLSCDDLVVSNTGGSDCTIIEWARPGDFTGVLDPPSTNSGCGPFEQPGEDGSCGPVSGVQRLLGQTAEVVSANLGEIVLCDPIVCNPGI